MQVIQCLYKIGICTLPTAYLVQFPGIELCLPPIIIIASTLAAISFALGLSFLGCVTDRIHNTNIITFFFENFNKFLKFIVVKCRLRHNTNRLIGITVDLFDFFGTPPPPSQGYLTTP